MNVGLEQSGMYMCEISEDEPLFHTDLRQSRMQVVALPIGEPVVTLEKPFIGRVDSMIAHCKIGPSYPAANITWYINGRKVSTKNKTETLIITVSLTKIIVQHGVAVGY